MTDTSHPSRRGKIAFIVVAIALLSLASVIIPMIPQAWDEFSYSDWIDGIEQPVRYLMVLSPGCKEWQSNSLYVTTR